MQRPVSGLPTANGQRIFRGSQDKRTVSSQAIPGTKASASRRFTATSRSTQFASPSDTVRLVSSRVMTLHGFGSERTPTTTDSSQDSDEAPRQPNGPVIGCRPGDGSYLLTVGRRNSRARPGTSFTGSVIRVASVGVARHRLGGEDSVWGAAAAAVVAPIHAGYSPSSTPCSAKTDSGSRSLSVEALA